MVAHAAVRSLLQILDDVLNPARGRWICHNRAQLRSLHEKVSFFLDFPENAFSGHMELQRVETKIRDAANKAKFVIESDISNQLLADHLLADQLLKDQPTADGKVAKFVLFLFVLLVVFDRLYYTYETVVAHWLCTCILTARFPCRNKTLAFIVAADVLLVFMDIFFETEYLLYLTFETLIAPCIQSFITIIHVFLVSVQFLLPVSFQNASIIIVRLLYPAVIDILEDFFVVTVLCVVIGYLGLCLKRYSFKDLKWLLFLRFRQYASAPENQDLREAIDDFSAIMKEVIKIMFSYHSRQNPVVGGLSRWNCGGIGKNVVVGLDDKLKEIYGRLFEYHLELQITSIVGMGGIGKTTLARRVHDDAHKDYHFDLCAWITVSQKYSLRRVMLSLLDSAKICTQEILLRNQHELDDVLDQKLGQHLHKNLTNRRYLIVIDDLWDTKVWDFVRIFFPDNSNGSRVLLTTRLSEVATYANSGSTSIHMRFLNDDDSWNLLCEKVFEGESCPPEIEAIGRVVARNCRGLPLAIVVVGGLLYNEPKTLQEWERVSNNLNTILTKEDGQCPEILGLSYNHLPHRLKPCFLYMGSFAEDEEIYVNRLFNLWVAEGFLEASKVKSLEEVAEEYLEDLIQRNLIMVGKWSCNRKIKTCKIHDLIRDFCWLNASKENFLYFSKSDPDDNDEGEILHRIRTLFDSNASDESRGSYVMARSFIYAGKIFDDISHIYLDLRLLRVLDVVPANLHEFPDAIFKLVHLRYLGVTYNYRLPPAISRLWNLETIVYHGRRFRSSLMIPVEIWSLPNLRHLYFRGDFLPDPPSFRLQILRNKVILGNLQTLVGISNFRCTKEIIESIPHLKKLGILYDGSSFAECHLESLVNLHQLQSLKISMQSVSNPPKLGFPRKLKKLSLSGCRLPWEWMRAVGELFDLQVLKLRNYAFQGQIWEPVEGQFCQLMFLLVEDADFEEWRADEDHFPRLQRLVLRRCCKLQEIPFGIGEIPTLERIELVDCHAHAMASAKLMQEEQQSMGNEHLKIHIQGS